MWPQLGVFMRSAFFCSLAQGSQPFFSQPAQHVAPSAHCSPHFSQQQQSRPKPGNNGQNSEQWTSQTVFLTSFISQTILQYFSHGQQQPQWLQRPGEPQMAAGSHVAGALQASPARAVPAISQAAAKDNSNIRIGISPYYLVR
jgi:hypothetical protein